MNNKRLTLLIAVQNLAKKFGIADLEISDYIDYFKITIPYDIKEDAH